jgi:hypothetical protein
MTLQELSRTLPNGFHDAFISTVNIDYVKQEARLSLSVWCGELSSEESINREIYRNGELILSGLSYWVVEPPDPNYDYDQSKALWIDAGELSSENFKPTIKLPELAVGAFGSWIFVRNWNAFMYFAARESSFNWKE